MAAFTYQAKKARFSLAHNTLTVYTPYKMSLMLSSFKSISAVPVTLHRKDPLHKCYHDDSFNRDVNHYHLQFPIKLDTANLQRILSVLVDKNMLTIQEKQDFLNQYTKKIYSSIVSVKKELATLNQKADSLAYKSINEPKIYRYPAEVALRLHQTLDELTETYLQSSKSLEEYQLYKDKSCGAIEQAMQVLNQHRGYKELLINLGAAILGLGVFYLIAASINYLNSNGKHFFFKVNTDSADKVEQFASAQSALIRQ